MAKLVGVVLVVVGVTLAALTVTGLDRDDARARTGTAASAADAAGPLIAVALPLVAALTFSAGIVLLVVGGGRRPLESSTPPFRAG